MWRRVPVVRVGGLLTRPLSSAAAGGAGGKGKVGFIGLGHMGFPMSSNLLSSGHQLVVFDVNKQAVAQLVAKGAVSAESPRAVAEQTDTVITMLPSSPHVKEVYLAMAGVFEGVRPGQLLIDSSTIDPETAQFVAAEAAARDVEMVDAPVSGGVGGAAAGTLTFMVGGSRNSFDRSKGILSHMGQKLVHCGGSGTGQGAKIANNLVLAVSMVAVSEGMNLGVKLGMDPKVLADIFASSTARCWSTDTYNPCPGVMEGVPASRGYEGGFGVDLMKKDLGLAVAASQQANANTPLTALVHQLYGAHSAAGNGKKDFSSIYQWIAGYANK